MPPVTSTEDGRISAANLESHSAMQRLISGRDWSARHCAWLRSMLSGRPDHLDFRSTHQPPTGPDGSYAALSPSTKRRSGELIKTDAIEHAVAFFRNT